MKVIVKENRELEIINPATTENENNVEEIKLEIPEKYQNWNKKIAFITDNQVGFDFITNNTYIIPLAITKNSKMEFYIWLTKDNQDFRSVTKTVYFNNNRDITEEITPEEESETNKYIAYLEEEKQKLDTMMEDVDSYMQDFVTFSIENGDLIMEVKEWQE